MKLTILGSSSATPFQDRHPTSQLLSVNDHLYMIDCGEGTIFRINALKIKKNKIRAIFISHLHGDHCYGLIGLLTTMSMHERTDSLVIASPPHLKEIIDLQCSISKTIIRFPIQYVEFSENSESVYEDENICVTTIPLDHKIHTCGFLFDKKYPKRKILKEKIDEYQLSTAEISKIAQGGVVHRVEKDIDLESISALNDASKKYAYCSDTQYSESYFPFIKNVDVLYHESTFLQIHKQRSIDTKHSTAAEAATVAKLVKPSRLLIGHFSARYIDLAPLLEEARSIFPETELALEGKTFEF